MSQSVPSAASVAFAKPSVAVSGLATFGDEVLRPDL
jgi:hypothetical protein